MESDANKVLEELEASKQELKDNLRHLSYRVKKSTDKVNLKHQTIQHPLTMVGLSLLTGVVAARILFRSRAGMAMVVGKAVQKFFTEFQPELALAKGMALQIVGQKLIEYVDESHPEWKPHTKPLADSLKSHGAK